MRVSDKYLLSLLQQVVAARAGYRCEWPGCQATGKDLNPHHFESKGNKSIRYDPDACLYLCTHHHTGNTLSAHLSPEYFKSIIIYERVRDSHWLNSVIRKKNMIVKFNNVFKEEWKERLQEELLRFYE